MSEQTPPVRSVTPRSTPAGPSFERPRAFERKVRLSSLMLLLERLWPRLWIAIAIAAVFVAVTIAGLWLVA